MRRNAQISLTTEAFLPLSMHGVFPRKILLVQQRAQERESYVHSLQRIHVIIPHKNGAVSVRATQFAR